MDGHAPPRRFAGLTFDADFLTAARGDGQRVRFSRLERALLTTLAARPGRLFSREQLLSAMSADPEELSDRNVDFVINRLRKKLGDPARAPRFIATQYGEGYTWVAAAEPAAPSGFLVIGPLRGLADEAQQAAVHEAIDKLRGQIAAGCAVGQEIAFLPNWTRADGEGARFRFSVSADFIVERGRLQAAFTLRDELDGRVIRVVRCELTGDTLQERLRKTAGSLIGAIWRGLVLASGDVLDPAGPPLDIRMQNAALTLSPSRDQGWGYIAARLEAERAASPEDPQLAVMWATYLYARMIFRLGFDSRPDDFRSVEAEIERLVMGALPAVRDDPILRLGAAKMLFVVDPERHLPLVEGLVEESLSDSAVFAAALSQQGSTQAYRGDLAAARASYEQALAFSQPGSEFQVYLLVKLSTALLAGGDWAGAYALFRRIADVKPSARGELQFYYPHPTERPDPDLQRGVASLGREQARRMMSQQIFMVARYLSRPEHARNVMVGLARHLLPRFGPSILPPSAPHGLEGLLEGLRVQAEGVSIAGTA